MSLFPKFSEALAPAEFLARYGSAAHQKRWLASRNEVVLSEAQITLLKSFKREMPLLVLAGAWCGDCSSQCPIFERFAEIAPVIRLRYLDRDEHADVQKQLQINGGNRIPVALFFSEDGFEVARFGERTLSRYREYGKTLLGEGCATGIVSGNDPVHVQVIQDWLNEFERVQLILRLSPRLRSKHGD